MKRTCPDCRGGLHEETHRRVRVDVCPCGGIWFDAGELATFTGSPPATVVAAAARGTPAPAPRACQVCAGVALEPATFARHAVSSCPRCRGVWLARDAVAALHGGGSPDVARTKGAWWSGVLDLLFLGLRG